MFSIISGRVAGFDVPVVAVAPAAVGVIAFVFAARGFGVDVVCGLLDPDELPPDQSPETTVGVPVTNDRPTLTTSRTLPA
jgi:hypothetical protein